MRNKYFIFAFIFLLISGQASAEGWIEKANFGGDARHRATAFAIGSRGYIGLGHVNSIVDILYQDFWEYDPGSNSWTQKANFGGGLRYHAAGFAIGNYAYVGTGRQSGGGYTTDFWKYDPATNSWSPIASFPGTARRGAIAFVINGMGYVGTGQTTSGNGADFFRYNPANNTWTAIPSLPGPGRTSSVAFSIGDKGYVGTGDAGGGTNDFYEYNSLTNTWSQKAYVGPITRQEATGFAINGKGYILTGDNYSSGTNYGDMLEYIPSTDTWVQREDFDGLARRYLVSFVINNVAYAGTGTNGTNFKDFWEYDPVLAVLESQKENISFITYPNPATDYITITLKNISPEADLSKLEVKIYDLSGKIIRSEKMNQSSITIQRESLSNGFYLCFLTYRDKVIRSEKIIFQ
jgi:N-acetylneuraminic acid mutarotase